MKPGGNWYDDIPNEYQDGSISDDDALAHAFSTEYLEYEVDYMNPEEEYYDMPAGLDPMDEIIAQEDLEAWELTSESE